MQLGDDVRDGRTDPRDFPQAAVGDHLRQRLAHSEQVFRRSRVGLGAVGIAAAQRRALSEFHQQPGDGRGIEARHVRSLRGENAQCHQLVDVRRLARAGTMVGALPLVERDEKGSTHAS